MIRFTSGAVFKAISLCKTGRKFSDDTLADMIFPIKFTTGYIGHVKDCTKNLPDEIFQYVKENNQTDIADTLRTNTADVFDKAIKKELQQTLIATLQQILEDDTEVSVETQIGFDPQYTKATMIAMTSVDPIEFLANTLFGVCSQQTNTEGKHSIKELNTNYIENRKEKASHISFIRSTAILDNAVPKMRPSFAGDDYQILYETPDGNHVVVLYEHFSHSWDIKNTGLVEWSKRLLVLANKSSTRIKALDPPIHIPDLKPGEHTTVTANLDARYFEGTHELIWDIQTEDGQSCYPNKSGAIHFEVTVENNLKESL